MRHSILIADDDAALRGYLSQFLSSCGYAVESVATGEAVLQYLQSGLLPDLVLLDVVMPGADGIQVLTQLKKSHPDLPVIILSGVGHVKTVVEAIHRGAADYIAKPFEAEELELTIRNALEKLQLRTEVTSLRRQLAQADAGFESSNNARMIRVREIANQVADTDVPVLILGESGVGKGVLAQYIHNRSGRIDQPFIKVNCAALPHDLLESELFGHDRGAFTGAVSDKPGKFELARLGTILLDEIGDMSLPLQAKLLHVLQDREFSRVGGKRMIPLNARILASTNRRLDQAVSRGEFRDDLYFRLNVISIEIPPLRERREDIPALCNYLLNKHRDAYKSPVTHLPKEALMEFMRADWPGNIRQLENCVKRYLILRDADLALSAETDTVRIEVQPAVKAPVRLKEAGALAAEQVERELALETLEQTNWNRKEAARLLNISYKGFRNKLKKWNLTSRTVSDSAESQQTSRVRAKGGRQGQAA